MHALGAGAGGIGMKPDQRRLEVLQRYSDGLATRDEVAALERAILDDAEFRQYAIEYLHLDSAMEEYGEVEPSALSPTRPVRRIRWALAAAAAIVLMGLALGHWWPGKSSPGVEVEILQLTDARFAEPTHPLQIHDHARFGWVELWSGEAQLRLPSDVKLLVSGPAELRLIDPKHALLLRGKVTVDCGPHGQGFTLDTSVTRVVDVGTEFGVEVRADGATDVMVIKGRVQIYHPQGTGPATPLDQGEAVRVDAKQTIARIVNITGGLHSDDWSTLPPSADCNIVSVSDNFGSSEGYHFYRTVAEGLRPGAAVYSNRPYVWRAAEGRDFPADLLNADVVQTFFGELKHPAYTIEIEVARPVQLYVLMPRRGMTPAWLTENFTRTGEEIALDESAATPGLPHRGLPFAVWTRTVRQAGKVTLGPGNRDASGNPTGMYGIAAKALSL
jgi:ferric-dicitrate binding protein FerR (iron transport regulator)